MASLPKLSLIAVILTFCLQISAQGTQFITGPCTNDAACASGCCGFNSGKCAGPIIAQERDGGCGFGDAQPNDRAAQLLRGGTLSSAAPIMNGTDLTVNSTEPIESLPIMNGTDLIVNSTTPVINGTDPNINRTDTTPATPPQAAGTQFITGPCANDAVCASKCCGFNSGKCAGPIVAQERDGGCGFGNAVPNDDAARALRGRKVNTRGESLVSRVWRYLA